MDCSLGTQERDQGALFCRAELDGLREELGCWEWVGTEGRGRLCGETVRTCPPLCGQGQEQLEFCTGGGSAQTPLRTLSFLQSVYHIG